MGEPRIIVGEGIDREKLKLAMAIIQAQVLGGLADIRLSAVTRRDGGPFNKTKEQERRARQIQRMKEKG